MSSNNYSSEPRYELLGTKDDSTKQQLVEEITLPQHCPYGPLFAEWGTSQPTLFRGNGAIKMYGSDTFDVTSAYQTHQLPFLNKFNDNANATMFHRLIPPTATKSILRLSVEVIRTDTPIYVRNEDGSIKYEYNSFNDRVPVVDRTVVGHRVIFHAGVEPYAVSSDANQNKRSFGNAEIVRDFRPSTTVGSDGTTLGSIAGDDSVWTSTLYPIYDLPASYFGKRGDKFGIRHQLPTSKGSSQIDTASVYSTKSYLLRLGVVEYNENLGGFDVVETNDGLSSVDVSLKSNVRSDRAKLPLALDEIFVGKYVTAATSTTPKFEGPFNDVHVYRDSVEELQRLLILGESGSGTVGEAEFNEDAQLLYGRVPLTIDTQYLLNFLGGYDVDGVPYFAFQTGQSANFGGVTIVNGTVIYATGGADGLKYTSTGEPDELANYELFDSLVQSEMTNFGEGEIRWMNTAKYPISAVWDSGYSIDTKKAMLNVIGKRKDMAVILATQSVSDYVTANVDGEIKQVWSWIDPNTESEETAIAGALRTYASAYPESEVYGTSVCRAIIVGQCGNLINSSYLRKLPLTYELAAKVSAFMGAGDGYWNDVDAYDQTGNNLITEMTNVNLSWKDEEIAKQAWAAGLTYAEDYDLNRIFFPAVRTVYNDDTSVLNSSITMFAICYIQRVAMGAWRDLVGNSKFTRASFIQNSNELITTRLAKRFDGRFIIEVNTTFTEADIRNGFSWNCRIDIYAPNMLLVGKYTIGANRLDDYTGESDSRF
jgi:hypothetical protein